MKLFYRNIFILITLGMFLFPGISHSANDRYFEKETLPSFVKVYPNPVKDKKVTIETSDKELSSIRILNITGKEVYFRNTGVTERIVQLDLQQIPEGIYLLQIMFSDKHTVVQKLIISSP